jgi:hypothetical protein
LLYGCFICTRARFTSKSAYASLFYRSQDGSEKNFKGEIARKLRRRDPPCADPTEVP